MLFFIRKVLIVLAFCCAAGAGFDRTAFAQPAKIAIIVSDDIIPFREISRGFKDTFAGEAKGVKIQEYFLNRDPDAVKKAGTFAADLVFTIGSRATDAVIQQEIKAKLVFAGISQPQEDGNIDGRGLTGVVLDVPVAVQLDYIRQFVPGLTSVGIIYNPAENERVVERAGKVIAGQNLTLKTFPVTSAAGVENIRRMGVDALLFIPDSIACQPKTTKTIIVNSLKQGIPVLGLSSFYAQSGAMLAVSADYRDIGCQAALSAKELLAGSQSSQVGILYPRKVNYFINKTVAQRLGIRASEQSLKNAKEVFGQ